MEDLLAALDNKNPQIKEETCKFLIRAFSMCTTATLTKGLVKQIVPAVVKVNKLFHCCQGKRIVSLLLRSDPLYPQINEIFL